MTTTSHFSFDDGLTVHRLGFGAMRICGEGIWGWPEDVDEAKDLLRQVPALGINFIDTADAYGPETSEYLIHQALYPYPQDLVVATKGGLMRGGPGDWQTNGQPKYLAVALENSLRRLGLERIDLYQFHAPDDEVPFEDSVGKLADLKKEGKIRHLGLSNVSVDQIKTAQKITDIATVQNRYNLTDRSSQDQLDYCDSQGIGFIPWYPLNTGKLTQQGGQSAVAKIAQSKDLEPSQVALAWLLAKSPVMLPIPGTSSKAHLKENWAARQVSLTRDEIERLDALA